MSILDVLTEENVDVVAMLDWEKVSGVIPLTDDALTEFRDNLCPVTIGSRLAGDNNYELLKKHIVFVEPTMFFFENGISLEQYEELKDNLNVYVKARLLTHPSTNKDVVSVIDGEYRKTFEGLAELTSIYSGDEYKFATVVLDLYRGYKSRLLEDVKVEDTTSARLGQLIPIAIYGALLAHHGYVPTDEETLSDISSKAGAISNKLLEKVQEKFTGAFLTEATLQFVKEFIGSSLRDIEFEGYILDSEEVN